MATSNSGLTGSLIHCLALVLIGQDSGEGFSPPGVGLCPVHVAEGRPRLHVAVGEGGFSRGRAFSMEE